MAFDMFSMPQGPAIPVNLFAESATAGINAGNASPSIASSVVRGLQSGVKAGQEFIENQQQAEIRQNQIDQMPVANQMQEANLRQQQLQNQVNELKVEAALANKENVLEAEKIKAENILNEQRQIRDDNRTFQAIKLRLSSDDPSARKSIIYDPSFNDYLSRNPDRAESVLGTLRNRNDITDEEAGKAYSIVDFYRAQDLRIKQKAAEAKVNSVLLNDFNNAVEKLTDPVVKSAVNGLSAPDIKDNVIIALAGTKQVDKEGNIIPGVPDIPPNPAEVNYQMFVGTKLRPGLLNKGQATSISNLQDSLRRFSSGQSAAQEFLSGRQGVVSQQQPQATPAASTAPAVPAAPIETFESLTKTVTATGVPEEDATSILSKAKEAGSQANVFQRLMTNYLPLSLQSNPIINSSVNNLEETRDTTQARELINKTAGTLANTTLQTLNSGNTATKDQLKLWAKSNGVPLTYSGLKNYYEDRTRSALNQSYESAYKLGIEEQQAKASSGAAKSAINEKASKVLKGKTPEEAIELGVQTEALATKQDIAASAPAANSLVEDLTARTKDVASFYNLSPSQKADVEARVKNVSFNPILSDKPAYVKAVAAVESAGGKYTLSETNVVGPMQVTGAAASDINSKLVKQGTAPLDKNDPEQNTLLGQMYLEELVNTFSGNYSLAFAAYNAGPATIKYAQRLAGGSDKWEEVKRHLVPAIKRFYKPEDRNRKLQEVYNYPEKVGVYHEIFA